ncbi:MAG TPA: ATP-binding protein [Candidatus Binatia bacterium]|nr:ATP-binding protein [Candidatus Binatia bacterium]
MNLRHFNLLIVGVLWALCSFVAVSSVRGADVPPVKRVLIISTGSRFSPGYSLIDRGVFEALAKMPSGQIETYAENLDILRFPVDRFQRIFNDYLTAKYEAQPPDLIVLAFVGSLGIAGKLLQQLFPGTPVIVAGATEEEVRVDQFRNPFTGVASRANPRATLELIFLLQPEISRVVVIGGTAEVDRDVLDRVKEDARSFAGHVDFDFWDNRGMAELRRAVSALPPRTAILFSRMFRDGAGRAVISSQAGQSIAEWANVPVYVMTDTALGTGAVGGSVASVEAIGKRAGELARLVLTGTSPESLPLETSSGRVPMFDWRALKRWGISESRLPPNSIVRFRPQSIWEEYRWYIVGALVIIVLQSAMIIDLLLQRRRRRRVEVELRESQQLMELAASAGELGLWSRDLTNGKIWANAPMRSLFGFSAQDALRFDDMVTRVHPDDRVRMLSEVANAQAAGLPFQGEFRTVLPNGEQRWVLAKGRITTDSGLGRDQRRLGVALDITEPKRAEEALEKERSFLRQVIDVVPNFIFAKDRGGRFTLANRAVAEAYGTTVENLMGKTDADFNPNADEVEFFHRMDREVIDTLQERFIAEEHITDAQGRVRWLQTVKRPIIESDGSAKQVLGASTDITRRKETELELQERRSELAHVARISIMGELSASLAHELNQPLTAILSNAQAAARFMTSKPVDLEEVREILQDIVKDNNRAGEVIRRMRALAKKEELEFGPLDVANLIREVVTLLHSDAILQNVRISLEVGANLPPARGDRVQLQQVLLNLLLNAFDAMKTCPRSEREVTLRAKRQNANMIEVAVSDRGAGLSQDKLDKIFQPFYTTKGEGLGIGLSICRSIIDAHGGRLWAANNVERGAIFYFTVPLDGGCEAVIGDR